MTDTTNPDTTGKLYTDLEKGTVKAKRKGSKKPEDMSSAELKEALAKGTVGGGKPDKKGNVKPRRVKVAQKKREAKASKQAKPAKKVKAVKKTAPKARKERASRIAVIGDFLQAHPGEGFTTLELAKKFKVRLVEIHRACQRLEKLGVKVEAVRSGPTGKPGRRAFRYQVTK